ncbi:MAG: hypothetical protein GX751_11960 [Desulfuromonadaceae bacterium]|nr:hypothetical protein [Desulfuromonadaceae bacterium]
MKTKLLLLVGLLGLASLAFGDDIDIYGISEIDLKPNVLIILDNSGSMSNEDVPDNPYESGTNYSGSHTADEVYVKEDIYEERCGWVWRGRNKRWECNSIKVGERWNSYFNDINSSDWQCNSAKTELLSQGYWTGKLAKSSRTGTVTCAYTGSNREYALGNYLNFEETYGEVTFSSRMKVAKEVVARLIYENHENVNFGLMAFNTAEGVSYYNESHYNHVSYYGNGGFILAECGADKSTLIGNYEPGHNMNTTAQSGYGAVGSLGTDTNTPLAETLAEAGLYFAGKRSWFNDTSTGTGYPLGRFSFNCTEHNNSCGNYSGSSPIEWRCQKNYIILVTDGEPTKDDNKFGSFNYIINEKLTESAGDGNTSYLDDVADFLKNNDIRSDMGSLGDFQDQTITTYTIGFTDEVDADLLASTATRGGGEYYQAASAAQLGRALTNIIHAVGEQNEVFTAAAVPVSRANKAYAGNYVYYGLFQPTEEGNWFGNLKKYAITNDGVIQDKNGNPIESAGTVVNNAVSFWSTTADGPSVTKGGAGEVLAKRTEARNIYTYTETPDGSGNPIKDLANANNLFTTGNGTLTGNGEGDFNLAPTVIDAVRRGVTDDWPLGSLLHSQPLVVHYDTDDDGKDDHSVIFAGGNDGMLHCFDDDTGEELWGFIPPDLLQNLDSLVSPFRLQYFVDGTPVAYKNVINQDKLIIFGERRGGHNYTALDVSDYTTPKFKYSISREILGQDREKLGQSWGEPQQVKMSTGGGFTSPVFLLAGGYDTNQDKIGEDDPPESEDSEGRAVYAVDARTGSLFNNFSFSNDNYSAMTHSIIAVSGFENPKSRTTTRVYAGDMNGNLFAFRDDVFDINPELDGREDGVWGQKLKLYSVPGKKIWYPPNIVNEYFRIKFDPVSGEEGDVSLSDPIFQYRIGDYVFFGTGDRAHPTRKDILNGFYAIKNNWQWENETATIVEAYVDVDGGGKVKARSDERLLGPDNPDSEELYLLDVTDDHYNDSDPYKIYIKKAMNHKNNRGWFIRLEEMDGSQVGEKLVSSPIIFGGVIYFTTYIPDDEASYDSDDPCAAPGAEGSGYLYEIGYKYGEAVVNHNLSNDAEDGSVVLGRLDRRVKLKNKGIPPQPVLVVHEGKTSLIAGFEIIDPKHTAGAERAFWRQVHLEKIDE